MIHNINSKQSNLPDSIAVVLKVGVRILSGGYNSLGTDLLESGTGYIHFPNLVAGAGCGVSASSPLPSTHSRRLPVGVLPPPLPTRLQSPSSAEMLPRSCGCLPESWSEQRMAKSQAASGHRKGVQHPAASSPGAQVLLLTGSCCLPTQLV